MNCWPLPAPEGFEFDLNAFFAASGSGDARDVQAQNDVQKWLDIIRGGYAPQAVESLKTGTRPPFPYSDVRLLPYLQHSFWFLPTVAGPGNGEPPEGTAEHFLA